MYREGNQYPLNHTDSGIHYGKQLQFGIITNALRAACVELFFSLWMQFCIVGYALYTVLFIWIVSIQEHLNATINLQGKVLHTIRASWYALFLSK